MSTAIPWRVATVVGLRDETPTARTLVLDVPGWPGHLAGQHLDVRLTAEDGYSTQRSYSLASDGSPLELTVQRVDDGEVSPYLTEAVEVGDQVELRGPVGRWFVWRPRDVAPVLLVAGGSGVVPLRAVLRARAAAGSTVPVHLVCSVRTPADAYYADELSTPDAGVTVSWVHTRVAPPGAVRPAGRVTRADFDVPGLSPADAPLCLVCGPTGFVETVADHLVALGHSPSAVRTERFGPTG
ncbi:ferredoxin reductase [Solicola sp. PLA-1-18]|uniref:ferredoxin reductase n=1 Tax=Solicola sp. PLA-1-18 TaxID=3380532 RepID=UPI003B77275A